MTTVTAAEFNQRPSQVKRAAEKEPVVITEHSRPSFVLPVVANGLLIHAFGVGLPSALFARAAADKRSP